MFDKYLLLQYSDYPLWKEIVEKRIELKDLNVRFYLEHCLFSLNWWLELIVVFIVWSLWWKFVDKTRLLEITTYGIMVSILATSTDLVGMNLVLWGYPITLTPLGQLLSAANLSMLPVIYMLVYQYFRSWKLFIIAVFIMSILLSFVVEPLVVWMGIYEMNNWSYFYSVPIYIISAILLKWVINMILAKEKSAKV
ncbi:MAG TPA: hypothetical protein DCP90_08885 [Clostridiales bacterium]|nr:MAG: hypothetical protein A2Y22_03315 [Clostridiales bacterium GWD2_32_59]HAN10710.1 hypothetical protein [Clostridiales bacterium]